MRTFRRTAAVAAVMLVLAACSDDGDSSGSGGDSVPGPIADLMGEPRFDGAVWGIYAVDVETGDVMLDVNANTLMMMGSNAKIFSVGSSLDVFGPDHTFTTPVYAVGPREGGTLDGDLVLVASGDVVMGGRSAADGPLEIALGDHNDANALPFGALTEGNPLDGLTDLAQQVAASGITQIDGDVIIDDRLFETNDEFFHGVVSPIVINDNLVDVVITPGAPGESASIEWLPLSPAYTVESDVTTVDSGEETEVMISADETDSVITVTGQIAADADPLIRVHEVEAPAAFARTLFIEELEAAGVEVDADPVGPNPAANLPDASAFSDEVASLDSPPLSEIARLIMNVSYNRGADLMTCLLATTIDSTDCDDGLVVEGEVASKAGVPEFAVLLEDGSGGDERSRLTPNATVTFLTYVHEQPYGEVFKAALPVLGEVGSLAISPVEGPAVGNVFAKTGTAAWGFPDGQAGIFVGAKALGGYIDAASGRPLAFAVYVNGAVAADVEEMLNIGVDEVAAAIYEAY